MFEMVQSGCGWDQVTIWHSGCGGVVTEVTKPAADMSARLQPLVYSHIHWWAAQLGFYISNI